MSEKLGALECCSMSPVARSAQSMRRVLRPSFIPNGRRVALLSWRRWQLGAHWSARPGTGRGGDCGRVDPGMRFEGKVAPLVFNQPGRNTWPDGRISTSQQSRSKNPMAMMEPFPGDDGVVACSRLSRLRRAAAIERVHALFPPRAGAGQQPNAAPEWRRRPCCSRTASTPVHISNSPQ